MAKSNYGYIGAGGLVGLQKGVEQIIAERLEAQQLAKEEALAREKLWQANLENQRNFNLNQEQLGISKGNFKLAQSREAREVAEANKPKYRMVDNLRQAGSDNPWTMFRREDDTTPLEQWRAPEKLSTTPMTIKGPDGRPQEVLVTEDGQIKATFPGYERPRAGDVSTPKPATGLQQKAMGFYERMNAANTVIEATEGKLTWGDKQILSNAPEGGVLENLSKYGLSAAGKQYAQAMTDFMEAGLRDASGAAINRSEFPTYRRIYQTHGSDTPDLVTQRQAARANLIRQMKIKAGRAYDEFYGDAPPDEAPPATAPRRRVLTPEDLAPAPGAGTAAPPRRRKLVLGPDGLQEQR